MKRMALSLAALMVAIIGVAGFTAAPAQALTTPVVFFVPHQDDETLTMGADISASNVAGRTVYIVDVTDGSASGAWALVNNKLAGEGKPPITNAQFVTARYTEQLAAVRALMPSGMGYVLKEGYTDNTLTVAQATTVILKYVALYPTASFKTMSWLDANPDHANLGIALQNLCNAGQIPNGDCRFEQFRRYWTTMPITGWFVAGGTKSLNAYNEYAVWNPSIGRYSIGTLSVANDFAAAKADNRIKIHLK